MGFWNWLYSRDLRGTGAVTVILVGMLIALAITFRAIPDVLDADRATLVGAAFTLIGTLAGSYTGVRVGAQGAEQARASSNAAHTELAAAIEEKAIVTGELVAAIPDKTAAHEALDRAHDRIARRATDSRSATRAVFEAWFRTRPLARPDHPAYHDFATWIGEIAPQLPLPSYDEFEAWYREAAAKPRPRPGGAPGRVGDA
jgi:hypothetical protein